MSGKLNEKTNSKINPKEMSAEQKVRYVTRGVVEVIKREDLVWKFEKAEREGRSLVVKYGVDPTAPEIHIGHAVPLRTLRRFQDVGHDITFLIGDFTARIGDPSGRSTGRNAMTEEDVLANSEEYKKQIFKILIPEKTKIVYNSHWLKPLVLEEVISLLARNTVNNLVKRKSFVKRFENGDSISGHELIYPFLQAYDSVALDADIELGGTDQYFNLIFGRDLQPRYGQEPQVVMTTPLLEGLDGNDKMSKSLGNTVGITEPANDMYAKLMQVRDNLMSKYFELLTDIDISELAQIEIALQRDEVHPMDVKKRLARDITSQFHSASAAKKAEEEFVRVYSQGEKPRDMELITINYKDTSEGYMTAVELMRHCGLAPSNSRARKLVEQRGFSIDDAVVEDPAKMIEISDSMILRVGKRKYVQVGYNRGDD